MAEITYICKKTLVSTKPVQPGKHYPLSILDQTMEHDHIRLLFYYRSKTHNKKTGETTEMLLESFSELLSDFPAITGRLVKDDEGKWMIKCNDAGVRMVEARVKGSVDDWLESVDSEKELMLVHWEDSYYKPYFWSTFYVQITEFEEGGLAIGLSCTHLLADPICATMLIKSWADVTLTGKVSAPPLFLPLPPPKTGDLGHNHKPYNTLINNYKSSIHKTNPATNVKHATITLSFSDHMVRSFMAMVSGTHNKPGPSPFEALSGLFWFCISKLKGFKEGLMSMSLCLDMRKKLGLDSKVGFGNFMVYNKVQLNGFKGNDILVEATKSIQDIVAKTDNDELMDFVEWLQSNHDHYHPSMNESDLICSNLENVDLGHLAMFEEGSGPIKVSYYVEPVYGKGQVLILASRPGEGSTSRMVMVTLQEDEIVRLVEDDLIKQISPTIIMGLRMKNIIA